MRFSQFGTSVSRSGAPPLPSPHSPNHDDGQRARLLLRRAVELPSNQIGSVAYQAHGTFCQGFPPRAWDHRLSVRRRPCRPPARPRGDIYTIDGELANAGDGQSPTSVLGARSAVVESGSDVYIVDEADNRIEEISATSKTQWGRTMTAGDLYTVACVEWEIWTAPAFVEAVTSGKVGAHGIEEGIPR